MKQQCKKLEMVSELCDKDLLFGFLLLGIFLAFFLKEEEIEDLLWLKTKTL